MKLREALGYVDTATSGDVPGDEFIVTYRYGGSGVKQASFDNIEAANKFIAQNMNRGAIITPISLKQVTTLRQFEDKWGG